MEALLSLVHERRDLQGEQGLPECQNPNDGQCGACAPWTWRCSTLREKPPRRGSSCHVDASPRARQPRAEGSPPYPGGTIRPRDRTSQRTPGRQPLLPHCCPASEGGGRGHMSRPRRTRADGQLAAGFWSGRQTHTHMPPPQPSPPSLPPSPAAPLREDSKAQRQTANDFLEIKPNH